MIEIKIALIVVQIISLTICCAGLENNWHGGFFCFNSIPFILAVGIGSLNLLIK